MNFSSQKLLLITIAIYSGSPFNPLQDPLLMFDLRNEIAVRDFKFTVFLTNFLVKMEFHL